MLLDWCEVDPTKARKSVEFALEPIFEDGLMPRREERDKEGGEDGAFMRKIGKADAGYGCVGLGRVDSGLVTKLLSSPAKRQFYSQLKGC